MPHILRNVQHKVLFVSYFFSKGGAADRILTIGHGTHGFIELMQKSFCEFRFDTDWDFELNVETRGVADLPNYHFRDDAMLLWKAIKEFVDAIINIFYYSDYDVQEDFEIQEWIEEIYRYIFTYLHFYYYSTPFMIKDFIFLIHAISCFFI